jgi:phosphoadenosine phosphosulfate reductase
MSTILTRLSEAEINEAAASFEESPVETILEWAAAEFGDGLAMTSNFGVEGIVVIDHLRRVAPGTPVIYLNTGFQFRETDLVKKQVRDRFGLDVIEFRAHLSTEEQAAVYGPKLYESEPSLCCQIRKVEPLARALAGYEGWIAALRRDQASTRALIRVVEWNARHQVVKINPLARWTRRDVWDYVLKHDLPYNSLYDDGYTSIGCEPCTKRPLPDAHERSGRWDGVRSECGIHL